MSNKVVGSPAVYQFSYFVIDMLIVQYLSQSAILPLYNSDQFMNFEVNEVKPDNIDIKFNTLYIFDKCKHIFLDINIDYNWRK